MSKPIASLQTSVSGKWAFGVQESEHLPRLRRQALAEACGLETSGTDAAWRALPPAQREPADRVLADLVVLNRELLLHTESSEVFNSGFRPNLLTDAGLDYVCGTENNIDFFYSAHLGLGTTPTVYDSGALTATASGTAVVVSGPFFTAPMAGMLIHWDSGEEVYIASVTDGTNAVLTTSTTASGAFAVHAVNRTALASPSVSQTTRTSDAIVRSSGVSTRTMSWTFALETVNKNYAEGGIKTRSSGPMLSLFLLSGGTVTVLIGQQARLYYAFSAAVSTSPVSATWPLSEYDTSDPQGWDDPSGQYEICSVRAVDGLTQYEDASLLPTGTSSTRAYISTKSSLFAYTDGTPPNVAGAIGTYATASLSTYVSKSFYRDKTFYFSAAHSNTAAIRSFLMVDSLSHVGFQFLFDSAKGKTGNQALSLTVRCSLGRILTNP